MPNWHIKKGDPMADWSQADVRKHVKRGQAHRLFIRQLLGGKNNADYGIWEGTKRKITPEDKA